MRLTLKFLLKSLIGLIFLIFVLPMLIHHLDSQEWKKLDEVARSKRDRMTNQRHADHLVFQPREPVSHGNIIPPQVQGTPGAVIDAPRGEQPVINNEPDLGPKEFGPKAIFTSRKLGNYEPVVVRQSGPGEGGEAVFTSLEEKDASEQSIREYGFNMVVSDKIAMNRTIPDTRMTECKYWQYPEKLPNASVIIVFHNEGFTTLMRTIHSIINTSPPHLLHEVVMVDDFSDKVHLKTRLEEYIKQFNGKVKLFRNTERLGLIGTRTNGARYSTGEVIVFLDAHCECVSNWLPPLLARIAYDRTIMAVPIIDGIDWNTFRYSPVYQAGEHFRGIFEWGFLYKESRVPQKVLDEREHDSEPYKAPTHAGGLFAMDRKYFFELGAYDSGLKIWGGENFELSFKIWQCGGSIEWIPCSHVGHVYRNHMPYGFGNINPKIPIILLNYMRVVEVWLDPEHREYFYTREPTIRGYPIGDIAEQLAFKEKHRCRSFKWFLENVAIEVIEKYPPPPPNIGWGEIKVRTKNLCWDSKGQQPNGGALGAFGCHHYGGNQMYRVNVEGQIGYGERCIDTHGGNTLHVIYCPVSPTGPWKFDTVTGLMKDKKSGRCVSIGADQNTLQLQYCDSNDPLQQFEINNIKTW